MSVGIVLGAGGPVGWAYHLGVIEAMLQRLTASGGASHLDSIELSIGINTNTITGTITTVRISVLTASG